MTETLQILAIIGSPRNEDSWTYKVIRQIEDKMNAVRPTTFDYVFLGKLLVPYCDGCLSCVRVGENSCPEYETIGPIAARMDRADGIILGAPVHTFAVTGLMKNFLEYFMYKRNRPSFFEKKAMVTTTASGGGHKGVLEFLEGTAVAWGCNVVSRLGISSSQMQKEKYLAMVDEITDEMGRKFIGEIEKGELAKVKFKHLVNFRAMQNMTRRQPGTRNHEYWSEHDWLEADYYTDAPVGPVARYMADQISKRMRKAIRKGNVKPYR